MPQKALGVRIDPDVSDPKANVTKPAATAIADPLEDPPDQRVRSHGFSPGPVSEALAYRYEGPPANSIMASFPISSDPTLLSLFSTVAV
jgi:hypothetical protein